MTQLHPISIYLHWPFCESKCPYCDFNSHVRQKIIQHDWLLGFQKNIQEWFVKFEKPTIKTIYFGGGTPSLMEPSVVSNIINNIYKYNSVNEYVEISLEVNPSSFEIEKFKDYASAGVNRISIGVQSFIDNDLKRLGRLHTAKEAISAIETSLNLFENVSFDLIYGRQYQKIKDWENELKFALSLGNQHLSLYQLTIEENTTFGKLFVKGKLKGLPCEILSSQYFQITNEICSSHGFNPYEISNFSLSGYECEHNLNYWRCGNFLGIGPGAHGRYQISNNRFTYENIKNPEKWLQKSTSGYLSISNKTKISKIEHCEEYVIMGLRLMEGIDLIWIKETFGMHFNVDKLNHLINLKLIEVSGNRLKVLQKGRVLLNQIIKELLI